MLAKEIRKFIQEPILTAVGWGDEASKLIVYGTGYVETEYLAIMQKGTPTNGGVGFYQEQPDDYANMLQWFTNGFNVSLRDKILAACNFQSFPKDIAHIAYNTAYATLICRTHYHRIKKPLPPITNAREYAEYHKIFYNGGALGKADVDKNTTIFQRIINGEL